MTPLPFALSVSPWLTSHWCRLALVVLGLAFFVLGVFLRKRPTLAYVFGGPGAALVLLGIGGLLMPWTTGGFFGSLAGITFLAAVATMLVMAALLFISGMWYRPLAFVVPAVGLLGLGGVLLGDAEFHAADLGQTVAEMRIGTPFWLSLLPFVVPFIVLVGFRRLNRHELRPWLSMGLRILCVTALLLALPDPFFDQSSRAMTVLFVLDRSQSIPEDVEDDKEHGRVDRRSQRVLQFLNDSVRMRGAGHERDKAGLIVFGRRPRLDLPPSDAPRFNLTSLPDAEDGSYTDIGAALKLALASFPEGTARRIVLVSDGNENLGNAEEQARLAQTLGVQIDVLTLGGGKRNEEEVLVERVEAPPLIEQGARVPIRVLVRSHNPNVIVGRLTLRQITDKEGVVVIRLDKNGNLGVEVEPIEGGKGVRITNVVKGTPADRAGLELHEEILEVNGKPVRDEAGLAALLRGGEVRLTMRRSPVRIVAVLNNAKLTKGLNSFSFDRPLTDEQRSYTYEAEFQPRHIEDEKGKKLQDGVPGDRVQNNRASTHVVARGQGRVLLLENNAGDHKELVDKLVEAGKGRFKVVAEPVSILRNYQDRAKLAVFFSNFDCVILANVPAETIPEDQQEVIRSNTHDQGCGLVMIGGLEGFGAGGWQNTPVEKALPVDCDIKQKKVQSKGGLVMIMHACEMAQGNFWQKKIAKLAVERLGPADEVGILDFGFGVKWHVPMTVVGPNRARIMGQIDSMSPGDMPDFDPTLKMAHDALMDKKKDFGAKHIIIISDGDPQQNDKKLLKQIKADKITIATVGIATHGMFEDTRMTDIATEIPGTRKKRYYKVDDPKKLPAIYIKETRLVSQAFVHKGDFTPLLLYQSGPTQRLMADANKRMISLKGFVRTSAKESPLVEVPIITPKLPEDDFPILAHWTYGLGKGVAFTSDAGQPELWCKRWIEGDGGKEGMFASFWEQVIGWSLRPTESGRMVMHTEQRDGKIKVVVEARDENGKPDTNLKLRGGLTPPSGKGGEPGKKQELRFVQKNSGQYEAEVRADEAGSYFVTAQATRIREERDKDGKLIRKVEEAADSVRAGVTIPYSPEFFDLEGNAGLMNQLADMTDGKVYVDDAESLAEAAKAGTVFRAPEKRSKSSMPFHYWLLFIAAGLLLLDVAMRRLAFDADETAAKAKYVWSRLRGFPVPPPAQTTGVMRLGARGEAVTDARSSRRFEGEAVAAPPGFAGAEPVARSSQPRLGGGESPPDVAPRPEQAPQTANLDDLLEAKKRVWEERKKET